MSGSKTSLRDNQPLLFSGQEVFSVFDERAFKQKYDQSEELLQLDTLAKNLTLKVNANIYDTSEDKLKTLLLAKALRPRTKGYALYCWDVADLIHLAQLLADSFAKIEDGSIDNVTAMRKCIRDAFKTNVNICEKLRIKRLDELFCSDSGAEERSKRQRMCQE